MIIYQNNGSEKHYYTRLKKANDNGVYLEMLILPDKKVEQYHLSVVYDNGYTQDNLTIYTHEGRTRNWAGDHGGHSKATKKAIESLVKVFQRAKGLAQVKQLNQRTKNEQATK